MTEPKPRVSPYAADADFTTLPEPIALAETVTEQPGNCEPPSGGGWDGGAGGDGGGD